VQATTGLPTSGPAGSEVYRLFNYRLQSCYLRLLESSVQKEI